MLEILSMQFAKKSHFVKNTPDLCTGNHLVNHGPTIYVNTW